MDKVIDSTSLTFYMRSRPDTAWDSVLGVTQVRLGQTSTSSGPKTTTAYRAYFTKDDPKQGSGTTNIAAQHYSAGDVFRLSGARIPATAEILQVDIVDVNGVRVASRRGKGQACLDLSDLRPGVYSLRVQTRKGNAQAVYAKM